MRRFVVSCLKIMLDLGFWLTVLGAVVAGYVAGSGNPAVVSFAGSDVVAGLVGGVIGLIGGFLLACLTFGLFYLVFQIEENTRRGAEFFEVLGRRIQAREQAQSADKPADTPSET